MTKSGNVLLIGSGGREHAICRCLSKSARVNKVFVAPGNAGTDQESKCTNVPDVPASDFDAIVQFCRVSNVEMVFVGPEDPLCRGLANRLKEEGIACFGPTKEAAQIESDKAWAKDFMRRHDIPTADFAVFDCADKALDFICSRCDWDGIVVKASGLAAGKGVVVADSREEAEAAVTLMMKERRFGAAGDTVVLEERLTGPEVSCLAFTDGEAVVCMPPSQDHKRLLDGDEGPNTGGMGAYAPCDLLSGPALASVEREVLQRAVDGLRSEGRRFVGVLYAGLMLTSSGPRVLEFNCRLGDPETQVLLPLLRSDLLSVAEACVHGSLATRPPVFSSSEYWLCVVAVSRGYPGKYPSSQPISGLDRVSTASLSAHVVHAGTRLGSDGVETSGGRVLAVVASGPSVRSARAAALSGISALSFPALQFRQDIGLGITRASGQTGSLTYKAAGVDIDAGDALVEAIKPAAASTARTGVKSTLGQFGAVFSPSEAGYSQSALLVSGTDGVGTKLAVGIEVGRVSGLGQDLVAMCANDVLCHAAEPLFFLDYFATARLRPHIAAEVVRGVAEACSKAGCALAGGETAEMPGLYRDGDFDLAGFVVGAVEKEDLLPRSAQIHQGDVIVGLPSDGLHANGFSLVRKVVERLGLKYDGPCPFQDDVTLGEALLTPTRLYTSLLPLLRGGSVKAAVHVTGGGLVENLPRVLPSHLGADLRASSWEWPPVFGWLSGAGVAHTEMVRTFNCGLGFLLVVEAAAADAVVREASLQPAWKVGQVTARPGVRIHELSLPRPVHEERVNVGVLISGSGTNLQALIDHCALPGSRCRLGLVLSNVASAFGLERARRAGVETAVLPHQGFADRASFESAMTEVLELHQVRLVVLAGFMRILTPRFVDRWSGKLINVHPSLLPAFKGANAHKLVLEAGVRVSGASVHFVTTSVDSGAIIAQAACPVKPDDSEETLAERVKTQVEHKILPEAMEALARGDVRFDAEANRAVWSRE